jgi:hypothetical protein
MVFVLEVESSKYTAVVDASGDELLAGRRCAACGGSDLRLTTRTSGSGRPVHAGAACGISVIHAIASSITWMNSIPTTSDRSP